MQVEPIKMPGPFSGLSFKLMATIIMVILAVEVMIYLPSAANFRGTWMDDKISTAAVAVRVLDVVPDVMDLPEGLTDRLLNAAGAEAIVYRGQGQSQLIELTDQPMPKGAVTADVRSRDPMTMIVGALDTLINGSDRTLRIIGDLPGSDEMTIEVLVNEAPLRADLLIYSRNIFFLSLIVASMTAAVIYIFVNWQFITPVRRLIGNMMDFRRAPENATLIIPASRRDDELGVAERELAAMEADLFAMLRQRRHLADLGLAVAKINHDLRNTLTSAQLLSDQVATLDDPKVQRLAPRLVQTLDKAIGFAQSVLDYGRQSSTPPRPMPVDLRALLEEAAFDAGLKGHPGVAFANEVPDAVTLKVDPDQMARVLVNLIKNAREALEAVGTRTDMPQISAAFEDRGEEGLVITIRDNGPGLPPRARENLFVAFEGSARAGGTGLGLAIARELTEAHGGTLKYTDPVKGAAFEICLPRSAKAM